MRKISKEIKQAIAKAENLIGSGCERSCFSIGNKYVVKLNDYGDYWGQTKTEWKVYNLLKKYYPEFCEKFVIPFVYFGSYGDTRYIISEKAIVLKENHNKYQEKLNKVEGLCYCIDWNNAIQEYGVFKENIYGSRSIYSKEEAKFIREDVNNKIFFTNEELIELGLQEVVEIVRMKTENSKQSELFSENSDKIYRAMIDEGFRNIIRDVHSHNIGLHNGKTKIIDLGCFGDFLLERKIRADFNIDDDEEI